MREERVKVQTRMNLQLYKKVKEVAEKQGKTVNQLTLEVMERIASEEILVGEYGIAKELIKESGERLGMQIIFSLRQELDKATNRIAKITYRNEKETLVNYYLWIFILKDINKWDIAELKEEADKYAVEILKKRKSKDDLIF